MKETTAWLMDFGNGLQAAVGIRELLHLIPDPRRFEVPLAPAHCRQVVDWQSRLLPAWDLRAWRTPDSSLQHTPFAALVGYQSRQREMPSFGVVLLADAPRKIRVADSQACELPPEWQSIALSCFMLEEKPVPILDFSAMFSRVVSGNALQ